MDIEERIIDIIDDRDQIGWRTSPALLARRLHVPLEDVEKALVTMEAEGWVVVDHETNTVELTPRIT